MQRGNDVLPSELTTFAGEFSQRLMSLHGRCCSSPSARSDAPTWGRMKKYFTAFSYNLKLKIYSGWEHGGFIYFST